MAGDGGLTFTTPLPPSTVPPDPTGDDWRGLPGPTGPDGNDGTLFLSDIGDPVASEPNGTLYLDYTTGNLWERIANAWSQIGNLRGPAGSGGTGDLLSPGPIGSVTSSTGKFTALTLTTSFQLQGATSATFGSPGSTDTLRITSRTSGSGPLLASDGPGATVPITINAKGGGTTTVNNGPLAVRPATYAVSGSGAIQLGLDVTTAYTGTSTFAGNPPMNRIQVLDALDEIEADGVANLLTLVHTMNGTTGGRVVLNALLQQTAPTDAKAAGFADAFYQAAQFTAFPQYSEPGATFFQPRGSWETFSTQCRVRDGANATNISGVISYECDFGITTGSSAAHRHGILIGSGDPVQGYQTDSYIWFIASPTGGQAQHGLLFGGTQGFPIDPTIGTFLGAPMRTSLGAANTSKFGIDLSDVVFPSTGTPEDGGFLNSQGFSVDGIGTTQIGTAYLKPDSTGLKLDVTGSVVTSATVASGGSLYDLGSLPFTTAIGGLFLIVSTAGALSGTVIIVDPPEIPSGSPPANPVALVNKFRNGAAAGSGATINLTWSTTRNALTLQSGGNPIKVGTLTNAANDAAAATAGVAVGQMYRAGSALMVRVV